ncbi:MAG: carboxypeptidase regulatory-like domain-containing protein, partial [Candidatus Margulisbacteria bacterium]|nr:carboxypeptidase regulatory-like domain-containing protein [Candidatus Margulisiibacteriota bacterium]
LQLGQNNIQLEMDYGVSKLVSVGTTFSHGPLKDGRPSEYAMMSIRSGIGGVYNRMDGVKSLYQPGYGFQHMFQSRFLGAEVSGLYGRYFDGFTSNRLYDAISPITENGDLNIRHLFALPLFNRRINHTLGFGIKNHQSGESHQDVSSRLYLTIPWLASFTHALTATSINNTQHPFNFIQGSFIMGFSQLKPVNLRLGMTYEASPTPQFLQSNISGDFDLLANLALRFRLTQNHILSDPFSYIIGLQHRFYQTTAFIEIRDNTFQFGLSLLLGLGFVDNKPFVSQNTLTQYGLANVKAFIDTDQDHHMSEQDIPLPNVQIDAGIIRISERTNQKGELMLTHIPLYQPTSVRIQERSLGDPYLMPLNDFVSIQTRPGSPVEIMLPVVETGEIEGVVRMVSPEDERPVSGVDIHVLDLDGNILATQQSEFDGFFLFDRLPLGDYKLKVSDVQMDKLEKVASAPQMITLTSDSPVQYVGFKIESP